jgi:hypothetical protein
MASIHPYRTAKGERRYQVRYRDGDGKQRSHAFSTHRDAQTFKLTLDRKRLAARSQLPPDQVEGRRLFNQAEVARWLEQRREGVRSNLSEGR